MEVSVRDGGRMCGMICIVEGWYEMMVKSMGSGSVWCGRKEVDGGRSFVVCRVGVGGRGQREDEGRRWMQEVGCRKHVYRMV